VLSGVSSAAGNAVPVTTIDACVFEQGFPPPDFVKIDVEDAEGLTLAGMNRVATEYAPMLLIEIHGPHAGWLSQAEPV
jgi:FkbM family methyltransferase